MVTTLPGERFVEFPSDRSLGELYLVGKEGSASLLGEARGVVNVPEGFSLSLSYSFDPTYGLADLARLQKDALFGLSLLGSDVTSSELQFLLGLSELKELDLSCTRIGDEALQFVSELRQLRRLSLASTSVSDSGLRLLSQIAGLEELLLDGSMVTDQGLDALSSLSRLKVLSLSYTKVSGKGLSRLRGLTGLEVLRLNSTIVDDNGVQHVQRLTSLRELWLQGNEISRPALVELTKWLSDCQIMR